MEALPTCFTATEKMERNELKKSTVTRDLFVVSDPHGHAHALFDALAEAGFDPQFGARPIKRAIQRYLLNDLSKQLIAGSVNRDRPVTVDSENGNLVFRN